MSLTKDNKKSTRGRVLESACVVFAEQGFHDATVQEICDRAGANIAAVNYYFRDKESLYGEAWRYASDVAREKHGAPSEVSDDIPPDEQLYRIVLSRLRCIFDDGLAGCFPKLLTRELLKPSPALEQIVLQVLRPHLRRIGDVVADLLGPGATERQIHDCTMSIIAQFAHTNFARPVREVMHRLHQTREPGHGRPTPEEIARHMTDFSLAGIRRYREQNEERLSHGSESQ